MDRTGYATFVVRIAREPAGGVSGVVERVRTGEKARFRGLEAVGGVLAAMMAAEPALPRDGSGMDTALSTVDRVTEHTHARSAAERPSKEDR